MSAFLVALATLAAQVQQSSQPIDRHALVTRHNPVVQSVDVDAPLSVGNGRFAFTADVTGLQTFADHYHRHGIPTETLARWAWHTEENPKNFTLADASRAFKEADGRSVAYPTSGSSPAGIWLRRNPHDVPIGQVRFKMNGERALRPEEIDRTEQTLDMWSGAIVSRFRIDGVPVSVTTVAHPTLDLVAVQAQSALIAKGRLGV